MTASDSGSKPKEAPERDRRFLGARCSHDKNESEVSRILQRRGSTDDATAKSVRDGTQESVEVPMCSAKLVILIFGYSKTEQWKAKNNGSIREEIRGNDAELIRHVKVIFSF